MVSLAYFCFMFQMTSCSVPSFFSGRSYWRTTLKTRQACVIGATILVSSDSFCCKLFVVSFFLLSYMIKLNLNFLITSNRFWPAMWKNCFVLPSIKACSTYYSVAVFQHYSRCSPCPVNTYSLAGSSVCIACGPKQYSSKA